MELHIELRRQALVDAGLDPREADDEARRMFGNLTLKRDEARDMWRFRSLDTFAQDVVVSSLHADYPLSRLGSE